MSTTEALLEEGVCRSFPSPGGRLPEWMYNHGVVLVHLQSIGFEARSQQPDTTTLYVYSD